MRSRLVLMVALAASTGCGGVISTVFIVKGSIELAGARSANAENLSPYEYTSAETYLKKAREAHSYADFEHSLRFARLASERALAAKKMALEQNRAPQEPAPPPPPPAQNYAPEQQPPPQMYAPPAPQPYAPPPAAYPSNPQAAPQ